MIKVGIAGARGLSAIMGLRANPDVEITAICDLNQEVLERIAAEQQIPHQYRVFDDMLESDLDAVWIATPMNCHVPQAIAALEAGKHVMSEVTAGISMDELWWLLESVEKYKKIYMFAENCCYFPQNQLIGELLKQGLLGDPYYAEGEYLHNCLNHLQYPNGKASWRHYWHFGTHGSFYPTHSIGPIMQWFKGDRIDQITCFGSGHHVRPDIRNEDTTVTMCQLKSGKLVKIRIDCLSPRPVPSTTYFQLQCTKGAFESLRGCGDSAKIWLDSFGESQEKSQWHPLSELDRYLPARYRQATDEQKTASHGGSDFFIVQDFIEAIRTGRQPELDVYKACEWTAVALLSALSITNGSRPIAMPDFRKNMPLAEQHITL